MNKEQIEHLRFPIGRFKKPEEITERHLKEARSVIRSFPKALRMVCEKITDEGLDQSYKPEGWTLRQVIHHIADSHINAYIRFRWALTEDTPTIKAYDQDKWANLTDASSGNIELSLAIIDAIHNRWTLLLESMTSEDYEKVFVHPEMNRKVDLATNTLLYAWHCNHHLGHLKTKEYFS